MSMVKAPWVLGPHITSSNVNDFIIEALTPLEVIVHENGAFGGVCGARGGA
jgi:hypothetical protein